MIAGTDFEGFEGAFSWVAVLVATNVDISFDFDFFLDTLDLGIEGMEERYIKTDTMSMEVVNHRETIHVHPGNVVRVRAVRVVYPAEEFHFTCCDNVRPIN